MLQVYGDAAHALAWWARHAGRPPLLACVVGFTETALIPGISAAGNTPAARQTTVLADTEFLLRGPQPRPAYPLPPLTQGASPVYITRAVVQGLGMPTLVFNAGLPVALPVPGIDLGGRPAACVGTGRAMTRATVDHLWQQGLSWGTWLARTVGEGYLVLGECVVGGTTTALAVLTGLGVEARNRVNSSHPHCNHDQKWAVVCQGLAAATLTADPLSVVAAVGDPMQVVAAGLALAVSGAGRGVLLAGGTQMLAVWALAQALAEYYGLPWRPEALIVGTTRWVAADPTGDTPGLAAAVGAPLIAADLNFSHSRYASLRAYEQGFVKEGVAAGGCALAAHLTAHWSPGDLLARVESLLPTVPTPHLGPQS